MGNSIARTSENPSSNGSAGFDGPGTSDNSVAFGVDTKDPFVPKFPVLNGVNVYDPAQYTLGFASTENDSIFERDVVGDISLNKQYSVGGHFSSFEVGYKGLGCAQDLAIR